MNKTKIKTINNIFSKSVVIIIIILNAWFASNTFKLYNKGLFIPDSLIYSWFAFTTGELAMVFGVKKDKSKNIKENTMQNQFYLPEKIYTKFKNKE